MGIFKKKTVKPIPEECSNTREIMYPELVKSDSDVETFYEKIRLGKIKFVSSVEICRNVNF